MQQTRRLERHTTISDALVAALEFKTAKEASSNGWLAIFKKRHEIRCLNIKGEKLSTNEDDADAFRGRLKAFLENHGYKLDNIYNGDETSLFWKHFPTKNFVCRNETEAPGRKASKDCVTIQVCSNASGTHKIPLTIIGKSEHPRCLKSVSTAFVYRAQKKVGWIATFSLIGTRMCSYPAFILILDNAPAHPSSTELNEIDLTYSADGSGPKEFEEKGSVDEFIKKWNLRDCFHLLQNAWDSVTIDTLKNLWKNLLQLHLAGPVQTQTVAGLLEVIRRIPGCGEMSLKEVENWIDKDQYEPPYKVFNDSQLIEIAKGGIEEGDSEEELLNSNNNKDSDEESPNFPPPSLDEVLPSILQIRRWSRGNKIVTVEENHSLDSLMENMVQLKINIL
ncbi:hypothetical protein NQ318_007762 [Aromia moschata]|uniref:DDE-1 domain-containing protein n=1 Tax=Aromia moschata TaxID=1265417 RepID=A0AAV8YZR4_9CUCU|nr:hypothetical protein NQ318_007762 [Aromia moschata]